MKVRKGKRKERKILIERNKEKDRGKERKGEKET